jgi:cytochrome c-type biogenesis protein CcmF
VWAGITEFYPILSYALCAFVVLTIFGELHRGLSVQRAQAAQEGNTAALSRLVRRHYTRYGGYLVHIGVVICTIGITASMAHKIEKEFSLAKGESLTVGRFVLTLENLTSTQTSNYSALVAETSVKSLASGESLGILRPEMRRYMRNDENTTEVALRTSLREDLYLIVAGLDASGERAALKVFINPLQIWLWFGSIIMVLGGVLVALPRPGVARASVTEKETVRVRA